MDTVERRRKRSDTDYETSSFHGMIEHIPSEMIHAYEPKGVIDFTPATAEWALQCISTSTPYLGVCFTDAHCEMLRPRDVESDEH